MPQISIGRIVHYVLTEQDVRDIERRRVTNPAQSWIEGAQRHVGNPVSMGQILPMIVVVLWPNEHGPNYDGINGQVLLDGNDSYWVTSIKEGAEPGTWRWPERVS